ncbi:SpoIIE family protein phosphatase [Streptomyces formicae]|uniref:SpoIIE family protein phosphatase n=1 Tax=Streptomyces formicae TaxID=1616117 RepID=A0ABY3WS57_9ACTN|nr:SpoIIE family protein phosphatase [Streptomyces formicae]UNM13341.1 SpoIIE family protein phosphatase [Streptomyces formicae]
MDPDFSAALLEALFTEPPIGLHVLDRDLRIVEFNAGGPGVRGIGVDEASDRVGRTGRELGILDDEAERMLRGVLETGVPVVDHRHRGRLPQTGDDERVLSVSAFRIQGAEGRPLGLGVTAVDITERDRAERRLDLLYRAGETIGTTLDVFRTAQELADAATPEPADVAAVDVLDSVLHGEAPAPGPLLDQVTVRRAGFRATGECAVRDAYVCGDVRVMRFGTPYAQAVADLRPRLVRSLGQEGAWTARDPAWAEVLREAGAHSLIAVPLTARGVVLGMAAFYRTKGSRPFEDEDLELARDLAARAAVCVDNARRYTREHTLARLTQRALVPARLPAHTAVETAYTYLPVASSGVWYDVLPLSGARIALVAGDVSGRGMQAVTTMARLRTAVSAFAAMELQPDELLERLHDVTGQLAQEYPPGEDPDEPPMTAACLYVVYDPATRRCVLARAGHPPPVLALPDGGVEAVDCPDGPSLGRGISAYTASELDLPEGSILALQNAGLLRGTADSRLPLYREALGEPSGQLQDKCDTLVSALLPEEPADDALLLLARTRALGPAQLGSWSLPNEPESAAAARRLVGGRLAEWDLGELGFSTRLIASELVTNAVRYSDGPIGLRLIRDTVLTCEVSDTSAAAPHLRHADFDDEGGRGLDLVAHYTRNWGTRRTPAGKTIWTEQALP